MLLELIFLLTLLLGYFIKRSTSHWKRLNIDGPTPLPIFGNMFDYITSKKHYGIVYDDIYRAYPKAAYVGVQKIMNHPAILIRDIEFIKDVMVGNFNSFHDNDFNVDENLDFLISHNPFMSKGEKWKFGKSIMAPLFTSKKMKLLFPTIEQISEHFVQFMRKDYQHQDVHTRNLCSKFALEIIASCGLGVEADSFKKEESIFQQMTDNIYSDGSLIKTTAVLFLPALSRFLKISFISKHVDQWLRSIVGEVLKRRRQNADEHRNDMIQGLFEAQKKTDISDGDITGYCLTMILESSDTAASLLTFCLYELACNIDCQRKAQQEIDAMLHKSNGDFNFENLNAELPYIDAILYESLRLYAPMLVLTKICTQRFELPPQYAHETATDKKVFIEPGTVMVVPVYSIHHDEKHYENPNKFDPERFCDDRQKTRNNFTYLPFGEGPRLCIGMKFALLQSKTAIAKIMANFNVKLSPKQEVPFKIAPTTFLLSSESPIWLNFESRN